MRSRILFSTIVFLAASTAGPAAFAAEIPIKVAGMRITAQTQSIHELRWSNVEKQVFDVSCGSAALATVFNHYYGDDIVEEGLINGILYQQNLKESTVRDRGGFSLLDLKKIGTAIGYDVRGYRLSLDQLGELEMPAVLPIVIRNFRHFVVFRKAVGDRVVLADPAFGNIVMKKHDFERIWRGVALVIGKEGVQGSEWKELPFEQYFLSTDAQDVVSQAAIRRRIQLNVNRFNEL